MLTPDAVTKLKITVMDTSADVSDTRVVHGQGVAFGQSSHGACHAGDMQRITEPDSIQMRTLRYTIPSAMLRNFGR